LTLPITVNRKKVDFPPILQFTLACPPPGTRYIVLYGGRGAAKSWSVARYLLMLGASQSIRVLCTRQLQNSMKDSVHQLLRDQIRDLNLEGDYIVKDTEIVGRNNETRFMFAGLQALKTDPTKLKSYEGVDICWIEEAVNVLKSSFDMLDPTIRKPGSKIIITFNPELETDFVYDYFVKKEPPPGSVVQKVGYADNPWFPPVLKTIMEHRRNTDQDGFLHIWEGHCKVALEGAIYAEEIRNATLEGRICKVPYDPTRPVDTFWDLGKRDQTSIWFAQIVGFENRIIDFYENRQKFIPFYLDILQQKRYVYNTHYLPHDADYEYLSANGRTVASLIRASGQRAYVIPRPPTKQIAIDAARMIFPNCWFDSEKCSDGLQRLRHYRYEVDPDTKLFSKEPLHDENSHAADGFGTLGLFLKAPKQKNSGGTSGILRNETPNPQGWMMR
jgi:phage terminase large subunit